MVKRKYSEIACSREVKIEPKPKMPATSPNGNLPFINPMNDAERQLRTIMDDFVQVYERLETGDDVTTKPNYSYTELVYLAILRSPNFCLPITEIYNYMRTRFSFFRNSTREHWKNAVRHSLSKTKCFTKISVGRGYSVARVLNRSTYLWCIIPGSIVSFARGDYRPNSDKESGINTLRWGYYRVNAGQFWDQVAAYLEHKMAAFKREIASHSRPGIILELQKCFLPEKSEDSTVSENKNISSPLESLDTENIVNSLNWATEPDVIPNGMGQDVGINSSPNEISPSSSRDSGNETLSDSSPDEIDNKYSASCRMQRPSLNSSYLSSGRVSPVEEAEINRKTPEALDLGQLSPLELSPISNVFHDDFSAYLQAPVPPLPLLPTPAFTQPNFSYYDNMGYYHQQYHTAHDRNLMYPAYYPEVPPTYPMNYVPIHGNDPMFSTIVDWNAM